VKKTVITAILAMSCLWPGGAGQAAVVAEEMKLTVGQQTALLDGQPARLDAPAQVVDGVTLVPLRFVGEAFGAQVAWDSLEKRIAVSQGGRQTTLWIGKKTAKIDGVSRELLSPPMISEGRTLVPLRFVAEAFSYQVDYQPQSKLITVKKPNLPPVAKFVMDKSFALLGEQVIYRDLSVDPEGDEIVDWVWKNNNQTFKETGFFVVSLKVKDSRGQWSDWYEQTIEVAAHPNTMPVASFSLDSSKVYVGDPVTYTDTSYDPDEGDEIVDRVWANRKDSFSQPGEYFISLMVRDRRGVWSSKAVQTIQVVVKPNFPPVAQFSTNALQVDQGETVTYRDLSYDPDGDAITEVKWTGKQRAYFKAGPQPVTLQVKDSRGKWSDPFTVTIDVSLVVRMTELSYNLAYPIAGETVNLTGINPLLFPEVQPYSRDVDRTILLLSNSPESVKENGILYRDSAEGPIRLMYHHSNGTPDKKRIYILAENRSKEPVSLTISKAGFGGPNTDVLTTGKNGLARYLTSKLNRRHDLLPGQAMILDGVGSERDMLSGQTVFNMIDLMASGNVTFTFVMADPGGEVLSTWRSLPELARDNHPRGTFYGVNKTISLRVSGSESQRFTLADNRVDSHLGGIDALSGEAVSNAGNYGVVYHFQISADTQMGLLTNPRGGVFRGVGLNPDGSLYGMPEAGLISSGAQAVMNLTLAQGEKTDFVFIPPAASNLPVLFLFVPFETGIASR